MKISTLIKELQLAADKHGDLDVLLVDFVEQDVSHACGIAMYGHTGVLLLNSRDTIDLAKTVRDDGTTIPIETVGG